jgi:hypothetical protein
VPSLTALLMTLALAGTEARDEQLLRAAEEAFRAGIANQARVQQAQANFAQAAAILERLEDQGLSNRFLYLDLGNAYFLAGRADRAVWAYQCGLLLDPNDGRLREQLALARAAVRYPPGSSLQSPAEPWPLWLPPPTQNLALGIALVSYTGLCIFITFWLPRRTVSVRRAAAACLVVTAVCLGCFAWLRGQSEDLVRHPLVVLVEPTPLLLGNGPSYPPHPDVPTLPRGMEVRQRLRRGSWLQVELPGGARGWLPASSVLVVELHS